MVIIFFLFAPDIECGPLDNPENGAVTFQSTNFGSIAIYQCDAGFTLLGEARRTCQITGSWSSSDPLCQGSLKYLIWGILEFESVVDYDYVPC